MNNCTFSGRIGKDAEVRSTQSGQSVCGFSLAVDSGYGDKKQTLWFDCSIWGKRAEGGLPQYLVKGAQVVASGEMGTREHDGKTYLTLNVSNIDLVGGKAEGGSQPAPKSKPEHASSFVDDDLDSLPF